MQYIKYVVASVLAALIFIVIVAYRELPSPVVIYTYFYEWTHFEGNYVLLETIPLPKPKVSIVERTRAINAELHAKSDVDLRSIAHAQRPCASGLIDCRGMREGWVKDVALQEEVAREKQKDQQIAQVSAEAALQSARTADWNFWVGVFVGAATVGTAVGSFLAWLGGRRRRKHKGGRKRRP